jgi:hypothetical protein
MSKRNGILGVLAVGLIMLLLSFAGIISDFLAGLKLDMDGLLLISVSLTMALVFAAMIFFLLKQEGWLGGHKAAESAPPAAAGQK